MSEFFNYAAVTGIGALIVEAIVLFIKTEKIELILLNDRKKLTLDFVRITIIGFCLSLILYSLLVQPSMDGPYSYIATFFISWIISVEVYYISVSLINDIGFGNSYYIHHDVHGKLYIIKHSSNKFILLADKPRIKDSSFSIFMEDSFIEGIKIYTEHAKDRRLPAKQKRNKDKGTSSGSSIS